MQYFTQEYLDFFQELEENNVREWFHANKKRYEKSVKEPFKAFVADLINKMREEDPDIQIEPKQAIFRINRDVRFSKDKAPYKIHMSAAVSRGGRKDPTTPGLYIQVNHVDTRIYSGCYAMEKEDLYNMRAYISENNSEFEKVINAKDFVNTFGEVLGEKNKRLPKEFQEAAEKQPLIFNKSFYFFKKFKPEVILKDNLMGTVMKTYAASEPVRGFLMDALGK